MKYPRLIAALAATFFAAPLGAASHSSITHHHPVFAQATTTYILEDWKTIKLNGVDTLVKDGVLIVEWISADDSNSKPRGGNPDRPDKIKYRVTITRTSAESGAYYSLLTLGIHSPRHKVTITDYTGGVMIVKNPKADKTPVSPKGVTLDAISKGVKDTVLDEDTIGFLQFTGTDTRCTFDVIADDRYIYAETRWAANNGGFREGHDTEPPENPPR